jgi:FixJ family two-component response regulator
VSSHLVAVVDDDASVRRALTRLLRSADLRVLVYASAAEFLDTRLLTAPDCVILDIHLGGMNGLELLLRLRELGHTLPVLIITAHDDAQTREAAARGGCAAYLRKPVDAKELLGEVATAMNRAA